MATGNLDKETGMVDCSVGAIVWVRRRNGSWWPGKILGPDELSDAHLMSPRSGTPVKLLGREDASVDWYNLEKSKRVKAFRCGEFDDCIERAESSLGMAPKKREKYARREDAILHALELEKEMLEKKNSELVFSSAGKKINSSLKDKSFGCSSLYGQKVKEVNEPTVKEDNSVTPRMRGLQDLGPRISPSKQKLSTSSLALNGSRRPVNKNMDLPNDGLSTENTVHADSKSYLSKRRTSHELMTNESVVRRRDRRRPLVQVLQSSAESPVQHSLQHDNDTVSVSMSLENQTVLSTHRTKKSKYLLGESSSDCLDKQICLNQMLPTKFEAPAAAAAAAAVALGEENDSESTENTETDCSETDSLHSNADEKRVKVSDVVAEELEEPKLPRRSCVRIQHGTLASGEPENLALASDITNLCPGDTISASSMGGGVSKWKLKGKRNNRSSLAKRWSTDGRFLEGTNHEEKEIKGCDLIENKSSIRMRSFDLKSRYLSASKGLDDDTKQEIINWDNLAWNGQPVMKGGGYLDHPVFQEGRGSSCGGRWKSMLVDVELKVQSSYQREHVPMISLMSKLNGKAIVGHPIQIESLENGSSDILLSKTESLVNDTSLPSMWKTARRTAKFRVPRSHALENTLDGEEEEIVNHFQFPDQDKKNILGVKSSRRKYSRRPPKKIRLSSGQKIKTLSSIGMEQKLGSSDYQHGNNNHQVVGGLIKVCCSADVACCIPVKLVFSRIYEELVGRHQ